MKFLQGTATGILVASAALLFFEATGVFAQDPPAQEIGTRAPAGTAFQFQGRLEEGGVPATGPYDFQFQLFDAAVGAVNPSIVVSANDLQVTNGVFSLPLDFGANAFQGQQRFIEVRFRPGASVGGHTTLPARQELTPAPYALFAANTWSLTGNAGTTPGTHFIGTVDNTALEFKVNGARVGLLSPAHDGANVVFGHPQNAVAPGVEFGTISGGGWRGTVGGYNLVTDDFGTIAGGSDNYAGDNLGSVTDATFATVSGGESNWAFGKYSVIGGGTGNLARGERSVVSGGANNEARDYYSYVGGGESNWAGTANADPDDAEYAIIVGGRLNRAESYYSTIVGGADNIAERDYTFIGSGDSNRTSGEHGNIVGGSDNVAHTYASVVGGARNAARASYGFVGGGTDNEIVSGVRGFIGGGGKGAPQDLSGNIIFDDYGVVVGGAGNAAGDGDGDFTDASHSSVGGGLYNWAGGKYATIPGGQNNAAMGDWSFAAGRRAQVLPAGDGSFAWADSEDEDWQVIDANTFAVRAAGGFGINVASPAQELDVQGRARFRGATATNLVIGAAGPQTDNMTLDLVKTSDAGASEVSARINFNGEAGATDHRGFIAFSTRDTGDAAVTQRIIINRSGDLLPQMAGLDLGGSAAANRWDTVYAVNALNTSDARLKTNVEPLQAGLAEVLRLQPRTFEWIESNQEGIHSGFIAQETREVLPWIVRGSEDGDEVLAIAYNELLPVLVKAIQEQQAMIDGMAGGTGIKPAATSGNGSSTGFGWLVLAAALGGAFVLTANLALGRMLAGGNRFATVRP